MATNAQAASNTINCFDSEDKAQQFIVNIEAHNNAFYNYETQLRTLLETPGLNFNALTFVIGEPTKIDKKTATDEHLDVFYCFYHYSLSASDIKRTSEGKHCTSIGSVTEGYHYRWIVNPKQNKIVKTTMSKSTSW